MKESEFIDQNKDKWYSYESSIQKNNVDPDELRNIFIEVTDDLSYSRSNYPNRSVRVYLNQLARQIFDLLSKRQKISLKPLLNFYKNEVPQLMFLARKEMFLSFFVFIISVIIGIYSSHQDPDFARQILGDRYVEMTSRNIESNDPMAVYRTGRSIDGFFSILINNARIDIMLLGFGLLFGFGALFVLVKNGIMVGVFQYFFYQHGGFQESVLTIWLHGTIEISTIVLIGGVGLLAGKGLLIPGSYTRGQAFRLHSGRAAKLLLGILPFTFVAAVIEGFVTRQTGAPDIIKMMFILICLAVVIFYFVVLPYRYRNQEDENHDLVNIQEDPWIQPELNDVMSNEGVLSNTFGFYRRTLLSHFVQAVVFSIILVTGMLLFWREMLQEPVSGVQTLAVEFVQKIIGFLGPSAHQIGSTPDPVFILFKAVIGLLFMMFSLRTIHRNILGKDFGFGIRKGLNWTIAVLFVLYMGLSSYEFDNGFFQFLGYIGWFLFLYYALSAILKKHLYYDKIDVGNIVTNVPMKIITLMLILIIVNSLLGFAMNFVLAFFYWSLITDLLPFGTETVAEVLHSIQWIVHHTIRLMLFPLYVYAMVLQISSIVEDRKAPHLKKAIERISIPSKRIS